MTNDDADPPPLLEHKGHLYLCVSDVTLFGHGLNIAEGETLVSAVVRKAKSDDARFSALNRIATEITPVFKKECIPKVYEFLKSRIGNIGVSKQDSDICAKFKFVSTEKLATVEPGVKTAGVCNKGICELCDSVRWMRQKYYASMSLVTVSAALRTNHLHSLLSGDIDGKGRKRVFNPDFLTAKNDELSDTDKTRKKKMPFSRPTSPSSPPTDGRRDTTPDYGRKACFVVDEDIPPPSESLSKQAHGTKRKHDNRSRKSLFARSTAAGGDLDFLKPAFREFVLPKIVTGPSTSDQDE